MFNHLLKFCAPFCLALFVSVPLFGAEEVVSLTTQDGWILSALYQSAQENNRTVVLLHDLGKNKEQFSTFKSALAKEGFDPVYGARPLRRAIVRRVEDSFSEAMLRGEIKAGDEVTAVLADGKIAYRTEVKSAS